MLLFGGGNGGIFLPGTIQFFPNGGKGWRGDQKCYFFGGEMGGFSYQVRKTKSMKLEQKWNRSNDYS